jgi:hypothetical protein
MSFITTTTNIVEVFPSVFLSIHVPHPDFNLTKMGRMLFHEA